MLYSLPLSSTPHALDPPTTQILSLSLPYSSCIHAMQLNNSYFILHNGLHVLMILSIQLPLWGGEPIFIVCPSLSIYLSIFSLSVQQNYKRLNNWRFSRNTKDIAATKRTYCVPSCKQNVTLVPPLWEAEWEGQFLYFFSQETLNGNKQNNVLCTNQID